MAIVKVVFTRKESSGLKQSVIRVGSEYLKFNANDEAELKLDEKVIHLVRWYMLGNPSSTLSLIYEYTGKKKTAFESKIPSNRSRKTDFTIIELD
ncbi:hypothetical protein N9W89_06495 [Hellea sp.]|nr:hypothetical protein [Hellea sp.]